MSFTQSVLARSSRSINRVTVASQVQLRTDFFRGSFSVIQAHPERAQSFVNIIEGYLLDIELAVSNYESVDPSVLEKLDQLNSDLIELQATVDRLGMQQSMRDVAQAMAQIESSFNEFQDILKSQATGLWGEIVGLAGVIYYAITGEDSQDKANERSAELLELERKKQALEEEKRRLEAEKKRLEEEKKAKEREKEEAEKNKEESEKARDEECDDDEEGITAESDVNMLMTKYIEMFQAHYGYNSYVNTYDVKFFFR